MVAIGVDVGLKTTGYVICKLSKGRIELLDEGQIVTQSSLDFPKRLYRIFTVLSSLIQKYHPQVLVMERLYSHYRHPTTLGILAQVRGVVVLLSSLYGLNLYEYSPTRTKKAILGKGSASSSQVKRMVEKILGRKIKSQHIADAFSLIVTFLHRHSGKLDD